MAAGKGNKAQDQGKTDVNCSNSANATGTFI